jgi:hypothetical protein
MTKIILLGRCCRVVFDMIKLNFKEKSSLFDWVWSNTLGEINIIIEKLLNNTPIKTIRHGGNDYLVDTNIVTSHYINKDYNEIVSRRSKRFINDILQNSKILFIRDDVLETIKYEEIEYFYALIQKINPNLCFKLLLLSQETKFNKIIYTNLYHNIYNASLYKKYIEECFNDISINKKCDIKDISDDEK